MRRGLAGAIRTVLKKVRHAIAREQRLRVPIVRFKISVQEAISGRFGLPIDPPAPEAGVPAPTPQDVKEDRTDPN